MKIVTVLRSGGEYTAEHVHWFDKQLHSRYEHVCLTDARVNKIRSVALRTDWPGWFAKLELFNPELIDDDIFYIDLDTVIVGGFDHMLNHNTLSALRDFYFPGCAASGIMRIPHAAKAAIWQNLAPLSRDALLSYRGDGELLRGRIGFNFLQDEYPGEIISYKADVAARKKTAINRLFSRGDGQVPAGAKIICFHGRPRPWDLNAPWIETLRSPIPAVE